MECAVCKKDKKNIITLSNVDLKAEDWDQTILQFRFLTGEGAPYSTGICADCQLNVSEFVRKQ